MPDKDDDVKELEGDEDDLTQKGTTVDTGKAGSRKGKFNHIKIR